METRGFFGFPPARQPAELRRPRPDRLRARRDCRKAETGYPLADTTEFLTPQHPPNAVPLFNRNAPSLLVKESLVAAGIAFRGGDCHGIAHSLRLPFFLSGNVWPAALSAAGLLAYELSPVRHGSAGLDPGKYRPVVSVLRGAAAGPRPDLTARPRPFQQTGLGGPLHPGAIRTRRPGTLSPF